MSLLTGNASYADTIVIRPQAWQESLQNWFIYRKQQGHQIWELDAELGAEQLRLAIRDLSERTELKYILLAGDVQAGGVPTFYHPSTALVQFGGTETLASDNDYGDLNRDGHPELAVGRIPAKNSAQLKEYLQRVVDYEASQDFSAWRRDVHVVAGVGGFGAVADSVIEMTTRSFLADSLPGWVNLSMTQASLTSLYCPDPCEFCQATIERINQGGAFWVYIGHGWVDQLDTIHVGSQQHEILTCQHLPQIAAQKPPIALFLACYTGAFDASEDCLAEQLVMHSTGPIAAIAATRVSGPYGLAVLSDGLLHGVYRQRIATLGQLVLSAKQSALEESRFETKNDLQSRMSLINSIASAMTPSGYDLRAERQEHVWQINLLGDPLMRLAHPQPTGLELEQEEAVTGQKLKLSGECPARGALSIEFAWRRGASSPATRAIDVDWQTQTGRQAYQERYLIANQQVIAGSRMAVEQGPITLEFELPKDLRPGRYWVRQFLEAADGFYVASNELLIKPQ